MKREEHTQLIQRILNDHSDQAKVSELLTTLSDDYGTVVTALDETTKEKDRMKADNENLRDTNMRLFLKVGQHVTEDPDGPAKPETKKRFEDLFNEKGELK